MSASTVQLDPVIAHLEGPYVGLRPFERNEQAIFFGRARDAEFLKDKIFSARLTLLYAPSGVGKSSILRTLVTPALEEQHAWVKYFDNWTGDDPSAALKARLVKFASELGVSNAGTGGGNDTPTLTEIIGRIAAVDDRTAVLIFDQFEEFLVAHGKQLDPLRKELAALVRASGLDVRVVLSLRQEFLATLEPFRNEILNLFQSTYLLDSLDDQGLREAIEEPVCIFGGSYDQKLIDQLVSDLRASEDREAMATSRAPVDLPMMQIVCGHLWDAAVKRKQTVLTLALYKEMGGADKILEAYVRDVMPRRWSDRRLTARLMKYLAPTSGLKKPYTSEELAENEGLNQARAYAELERLSDRRILRVREYRGQKLFELQHDAFIRFIGPWRNEVLRRDKVRRRFIGVAISTCVVLGLVGYYLLTDYLELRKATALVSTLRNEKPEDRRKFAEMRLDAATTDLLFRWKRPELLSSLLQANKDLIPDGYGVANAPPQGSRDANNVDGSQTNQDTQTPQNQTCSPFCIHYSALRQLDENYFQEEWRYLATSIFAKKDIPVPLQIPLIREPGFPLRRITITSGSGKTLTTLARIEVPPHEDSVFIATDGIRGPAKDFLDHFKGQSGWTEIQAAELQPFGPLMVVPPWSRPVWKVSGNPASDGRGMAAFYVAAELLKNPGPLFGDDAMALLLGKARELCPQTVNEAIAARGYINLPTDLAEQVKRRQPLTDLPTILDALAAYPAEDSKKLESKERSQATADLVYAQLHSEKSQNFPQLGGPWKDDGGARAQTSKISAAYEQLGPWLPSLERPVKVYLGRTLREQWFSGQNSILEQRLNDLRDKVASRYGIELRGPLIFSASSGNPLQAKAYRIETIDPKAPECAVPAVSDAQIDQFIDTLERCIVASRTDWLVAEDVFRRRQTTSPGMQKWLENEYSLTSQKELLRAVIGSAPVNASSPASKAASGSIQPEDTLWHSDWLLRSLLFWSQVADPRDTGKMANYLRSTQRARLIPVTSPPQTQPAAGLVAEGISALDADRIPAAGEAFSRAAKANRSVAIQSFLATYPQSLKSIELSEATELCKGVLPPYLNYASYKDLAQRIELDESRDKWSSSLTPETARRFGLCSLQAALYSPRRRRVALESRLLLGRDNSNDWTPQEAHWLAERTLSDYDPYSDDVKLRDAASQLLKSAMLRLPGSDGNWAMRFVVGEYDIFTLPRMTRPGPKAWRLKLLRDLAKARPAPANLSYLANQLYESDRPEDLEEVLQITDRAPQLVQSETNPKQRDADLAAFLYYRATALERLSDLSDSDPALHLKDRRAEADATLDQLGRLKGWEETALGLQAEFLVEREEYAKAIETRQKMLDSPTLRQYAVNDTLLYQVALLSQLLAGNEVAAQQTADEAETRATDGTLAEGLQADLMFTAALGQIVTGSTSMEGTGRQFLLMDHPYVPYIAMMLYSRMASSQTQQEAKSVLDERWKQVDRSHWKERLRGGDETAWREMLLGMYLNQVQPQEIFDPLKDEQAFAKSDLYYLPMSRQDMLCEANFYAALLAESKKDMKTRNADLQKVLDTKVVYFTEYDLAKFLLAQNNLPH
jgi:hypothetical protein